MPGKFEQYKEGEPYIAIVQIIQNITNIILTLSEALMVLRIILTRKCKIGITKEIIYSKLLYRNSRLKLSKIPRF